MDNAPLPQPGGPDVEGMRRSLKLAIVAFLVGWPIALYYNLMVRHSNELAAVALTIAAYLLIGVATGTWRLPVSTIIGAVLGMSLVPHVNSHQTDDIRALFTGAFLGLFAGLGWHLAVKSQDRANDPVSLHPPREGSL